MGTTVKTFIGLQRRTGITGLKGLENPEHHLKIIYGKVLRALQKLPADCAYRKYTEEVTTSRLQIVLDSKSAQEIELKINCGLVEELLQQADYELKFARRCLVWKPWDDLIEQPPENQWKWPPV